MHGILLERRTGLGDSIIGEASSHDWSDRGYPTPSLDRYKEPIDDIVPKDVSEAVSVSLNVEIPAKYREDRFRRCDTHRSITLQTRTSGWVVAPRGYRTVGGSVGGKERKESDPLQSSSLSVLNGVSLDAVPRTEVTEELEDPVLVLNGEVGGDIGKGVTAVPTRKRA